LESVCVSLIGPDLEKPQACGDTTDEFGRFLVDYVAAGTYVRRSTAKTRGPSNCLCRNFTTPVSPSVRKRRRLH